MRNKARGRNYRSAWTLEEMRYVETHYGTDSAATIAAHLGRPRSSVSCMAGKLGVSRPASRPWTEEEDAVLLTHYAQGAPRGQVMARLPGRSWRTIGWRTTKLGIFRPGRWTREELCILRKYYPREGSRVSLRLPGRTREAVKIRACDEGLQVRGITRGRPWSEEEWALLAAHPGLSHKLLATRLPGRTPKQVEAARYRLGHRKTQGNDAGVVSGRRREDE